jgi:hypothetical protein
MTWSVAASGSAVSPEAEQDLYETLEAVLADPKYGAASTHFSGEKHNGPLPKPKKAAGKKT